MAEEGQVLDLMAALQASVERSRKKREGDDSSVDAGDSTDAEENAKPAAESQTDDEETQAEAPAAKTTARKTTSRAPRKAG